MPTDAYRAAALAGDVELAAAPACTPDHHSVTLPLAMARTVRLVVRAIESSRLAHGSGYGPVPAGR